MRICYSDNCIIYKKKFEWVVELITEICGKKYSEFKIAYKDEDLIKIGIDIQKLNIIIEQHLENIAKYPR